MGTLNTTLNQTSLLSTCQQYHVAWKVELSHMHWELSEGFKKWDIPNWERPLRWGAFEAAKFILALIPEKRQEPKRHTQSRAEMAHVCTQSRKYTPPRIKMVIILLASTSFLCCLRHFFLFAYSGQWLWWEVSDKKAGQLHGAQSMVWFKMFHLKYVRVVRRD